MGAVCRLMLITQHWNIIQSRDTRHLRHARGLRSSDMVITAICVHLMLSVFNALESSRLLRCTELCRWREREKKIQIDNIFGGFKFLVARKSPQYILGCVWCVSVAGRVLSNGEGGLGWESRYWRYLIPSTIHPMSPFCQHHQQKFVLERTGQQLLKTLLRQEFLF